MLDYTSFCRKFIDRLQELIDNKANPYFQSLEKGSEVSSIILLKPIQTKLILKLGSYGTATIGLRCEDLYRMYNQVGDFELVFGNFVRNMETLCLNKIEEESQKEKIFNEAPNEKTIVTVMPHYAVKALEPRIHMAEDYVTKQLECGYLMVMKNAMKEMGRDTVYSPINKDTIEVTEEDWMNASANTLRQAKIVGRPFYAKDNPQKRIAIFLVDTVHFADYFYLWSSINIINAIAHDFNSSIYVFGFEKYSAFCYPTQIETDSDYNDLSYIGKNKQYEHITFKEWVEINESVPENEKLPLAFWDKDELKLKTVKVEH